MTAPDTIARTVAGFCAAYGVSRSRAYLLLANGDLRAVKDGKRTLILEDSARAWLDRLTHKPTHKSGVDCAERNGTHRDGGRNRNGRRTVVSLDDRRR